MSGIAVVRRSRFSLAIACQTNGSVSVSVPAITHGVVARATYRCRDQRASVGLTLSLGAARRLAALGSSLATVTLRQGRAIVALSLDLQTGSTSPGYWSDGGLQCSLLGSYEPYLVAPDFTDDPATVIDVRPWVAWSTAGEGWRWLGTAGVNASRWYRWTATATGVSQWETPLGAINPWTWGPISVHPGADTYMIGVVEIVYWYTHPRYAWKYTLASPRTGSLTTYCSYP